MAEQFKHYTPSDFDKFDCVKISKVFYLSLIYLLRAYIAWVMSVSNMKDKVGIIEFLYPQPSLFYLNLLSGSVGLFILVLLSLRRPDAKPWVKTVWPKSRVIILLALAFDWTVCAYGFWVSQIISTELFVIQSFFIIAIASLCYTSKRMGLNLTEFPEPLPEK